jgi:thiol-disulfide isomerase/thioredoxin
MQHTNRSFPRLPLLLSLLSLALCSSACQQQSVSEPPPKPAATPMPAATQAPHQVGTQQAVAPVPPVAAPVAGPTPIDTQGKDFEILMLDSAKLKLSKLLGRRKVVVVNFWATWCGPCRREIPDLVALQQAYQNNKDVEIVGLTVEDPQQFRELVKSFAKQFEINYKVGFAPVPLFLTFNGTTPGAPIPQTFIFGKDGKLLQAIKGMRPAFRDYIQQSVEIALKNS